MSGQLNFAKYDLSDWLKLLANVAGSGAIGFSQGGFVGLGVAILVNLAALAQTPPTHLPNPK